MTTFYTEMRKDLSLFKSLQIKISFAVLILLSSFAHSYESTGYVPIDAFLMYYNDLDESGVSYGLSTGLYRKYFSLNTVLVGYKDVETIHANPINTRSTEVADIVNMSATFHASVGKFDTRFTIGKIMLPVGLYEMQRTHKTIMSGRTMNDSFVANEYANIVPASNIGGLFELDYKDFTVQVGALKKKETRITAYVDPRSTRGLKILNGRANRNKKSRRPSFENIGKFTDAAVDAITNEDITVAQVVFNRYIEVPIVVDRQTSFVSLIWDNRKDMIIDVEYYSILGNTKNDSDQVEIDEQFEQHLYQLGIERRLFTRLFVMSEYSWFYDSSTEQRQETTSVSLTYDLNRYAIHANYVRGSGPWVDMEETNIGVSMSITRSLSARLTYRTYAGRYVSESVAYTQSYACDDTCQQVEQTFPQTGPNRIDPFTEIDAEGLEFRIGYHF